MNSKKTNLITGCRKGVNVVELLVVVALVGIVMAAIGSLLTNSMKQQKGIQAKDQQREVTAEVRTFLNNKAACLNSFGGRDPVTAFTVNALNDAGGAPRFSVNTNDKTGQLRLIEFRVENWVPDSGSTAQGNADFKVRMTRIGDIATEVRPDTITLRIKRNGAGNIIECFSIGSQSDSFWQPSPSNASNIFYSGNVGINTTAPVTALDVEGRLNIAPNGTTPDIAYNGSLAITRPAASGQYINLVRSNQYPWSIGFVYNSNSFAIGTSVVNDSTFTNPIFVMTTAGDVGINTTNPTVKLDVNGGVRAGGSATVSACGMGQANGEGTQRYNYTTHKMEYCNGTGWVSPGGGEFGGLYSTYHGGSTPETCSYLTNPKTGACTCPAGFTATKVYIAVHNCIPGGYESCFMNLYLCH